MTKVMTPQGIERETDDLFYWDPKPSTDESDFWNLWDLRVTPEEGADKEFAKKYAAWLKKKGFTFDKAEGQNS